MPKLGGNTLEVADPNPIQEQGDMIFGTDPDSNQSDFAFYRRLGASHLDLNPLTQERMQSIALFLWRRNPYAHRILNLVADMAVGGEIRFHAEHPGVQKILTEHWNHPINNWDWRVHQLAFELGLYGETFQTANVIRPEDLGDVTWGVIDPLRVKKVTGDEKDMATPAVAHVIRSSVAEGSAPQGQTFPLDIIRYDGMPESDTHGFRQGVVLFTKINGLMGALRGMSDLFPLADYLDFIDQFMFSLQQRANLQNTFVWDVELAGKSDNDIKAWLNDSVNGAPPGPGSIRAHNERVKWNTLSPNLGASDSSEHLKTSTSYVLSGAGLADWVMGNMGSANRAATESSAAVIAKTMESRQRQIKNMLEEVFNFVIDKKIQAGKLPKRKFNRTFYISFPKIPIRDAQRLANAFRQAAQGVKTLVEIEGITEERKFHLVNELLNILDLEGSDRFAEKDPDADDKLATIRKEPQGGPNDTRNGGGGDKAVPPLSPAPNKATSRSRSGKPKR